MRYQLLTSGGNILANYPDYIWKPKTIRGADKYGVIVLHGANAPDAFSKSGTPKASILAAKLVQAGIPCAATQAGSTVSADLFANDTAMTYITNLITYLAAQTGCSSTKVHLVGVSMGGGTAVRYAALNPTKVASVTGIIPMSNIDYAYQNDIGGFRAQIGTAWGVTYPTALPAGSDLATVASGLGATVPTELLYSSVDTLVRSVDVTALATAIGITAEVIDTTSGHTDTTVGKVDVPDLITFLQSNGA